MADFSFNMAKNQGAARETMIAFLNTGTEAAPVWSPFGRTVEDSSVEYDWSTETSQDILGNTWTRGKKATRTQTFDPWDLGGGDEAQEKIWNTTIRDDNIQAALNFDCMIVHKYAEDSSGSFFAERFSACSVLPTSLGGEGGGSLGMSTEVTYGGVRTKGTASVDATGKTTFTADVTGE